MAESTRAGRQEPGQAEEERDRRVGDHVEDELVVEVDEGDDHERKLEQRVDGEARRPRRERVVGVERRHAQHQVAAKSSPVAASTSM
jgi:hypothetical protein